RVDGSVAPDVNPLSVGARGLGDNSFDAGLVIYLCAICRYAIHQEPHARSRAQKGQRRAPDSVAARGSAPSRLRPQQAHRGAIGRRPEIPRRFALPAALSTREARLDPGAVDREGGTAAPPLLPLDP